MPELRIRKIKKGDIVYKAGGIPDGLYLVRDGEIHVLSDSTPGERRLIGVQSRGSLFGEVSFLSGETHSSNAEAALDSTILFIPGPAFFRLLSTEPTVGEALSKLLSQRLRNRMRPTEIEHSHTCLAMLYPDNPHNGSELCVALGDALAEISSDPIVLLSWNGNSVFRDRPAKDLLNLIEAWPEYPEGLAINGSLDVFYGQLHSKDRAKLISILPGLIALLKKYYGAVLIDPHSVHGDSLTVEAIAQSDRTILVQSCRDPRVLRSKIFAETVSRCIEIDSGFFSRAILVTHEATNDGPLPHIVEGRFEKHVRLSGYSDRIEQTDATTRSAIRRIARVVTGTSRALCLGGGGARSFAHIGVLEVLEENGIEFDAVAGTSMGAVIGAAYCTGIRAEDIEYQVRRLLPTASSILDRRLPLVSFFSGNKLNRVLLRFFGNTRFEDLKLPFFCNSADLNSGRNIVFDKGYLATALRASVSLPGVFPPLRLGEYALVDGAVLNNLPGDILRARGFPVVLGINVTSLEDKMPVDFGVRSSKGWLRGIREYFAIPPILKIINRSITMESRELLKLRLGDFDYLLSPDVTGFDTFDFDRKQAIIEAGRSIARAKISEIKEAISRQKL
ncbi:MAG: patatin-like phospholipase family protein [Spirochaetia bacterium]|nr:patatin-like phospholipase family protein [Spirochaetia bacterium]